MSGSLKTMLRQNSRTDDTTKMKKNVRFVTESVSSGYSSSEIDASHMNTPMSPQQINLTNLSMMAPTKVAYQQAPVPPPTDPVGANVFQFPNSHRQLNFSPMIAVNNPAFPLSPAQAPLYFASLPTIVEQQPPAHSPSPSLSGYERFDPQMAQRWDRWTHLVRYHWPLLIQMDERLRFEKICELSFIAASTM